MAPKRSTAHIACFANALAKIWHCVPALLAVTQRLDNVQRKGLGFMPIGQIWPDWTKTAGQGRGRQGHRQCLGLRLIEGGIHSNGAQPKTIHLEEQPSCVSPLG